MSLGDVCVHTAVPVVTRRQPVGEGARIGGEREHSEDPVPGAAFDCCLFLPLGTEDRSAGERAGRQVKRPTLLWEAGPDLSPEDQLDITAPELPGHDVPVRYKIDGAVQWLGRPGDDPKGFQARLLKVTD